MIYKTAKMPLNIISERLRWWIKQDNVKEIKAYVNDCIAWLEIKLNKKETQAQKNARLIHKLSTSNSAKRMKIDIVINQIKEEQK